jgi:hypothetical protein
MRWEPIGSSLSCGSGCESDICIEAQPAISRTVRRAVPIRIRLSLIRRVTAFTSTTCELLHPPGKGLGPVVHGDVDVQPCVERVLHQGARTAAAVYGLPKQLSARRVGCVTLDARPSSKVADSPIEQERGRRRGRAHVWRIGATVLVSANRSRIVPGVGLRTIRQRRESAA